MPVNSYSQPKSTLKSFISLPTHECMYASGVVGTKPEEWCFEVGSKKHNSIFDAVLI